MKITFLGTGTSQGVPVIGCSCDVCRSLDYRDKRLRTSIHILINGVSLVIDTGPDFRQQMLRERIKNLDAVVFTHSHKDHTAGLDDVRAYNFRHNKNMPLFGTAEVLRQLKTEYYYAFSGDPYPGIPKLSLHEILPNKNFSINSVDITPLSVWHMKLPVLGFRIGDFTYITDANQIPDETLTKIVGTKVLVLNALQIEKHISHFNLEEALSMANKIGADQTYFTHISHKLGLHKEISNELPESIMLATDGLTIEV